MFAPGSCLSPGVRHFADGRSAGPHLDRSAASFDQVKNRNADATLEGCSPGGSAVLEGKAVVEGGTGQRMPRVLGTSGILFGRLRTECSARIPFGGPGRSAGTEAL